MLLVAAFLLLASCTKEINLDYNDIEPVYTIVGAINDDGAEVMVTQTRNMSDSEISAGISGATVTLSDNAGRTDSLTYQSDGYYRPTSTWTGETGRVYTLSVSVGGQTFTSTSEMKHAVPLDSTAFQWLRISGQRELCFRYHFVDPAGEDNYYCIRIVRNGRVYKWDLNNAKDMDGEVLHKSLLCMDEEKAKENDVAYQKKILYEGDRLHIELWSIDRRSYDYLYSLDLGVSNASKTVSNFSGGALGYFSAYHNSCVDTVFHFSDIRE
jgi:hypothetical protein